MREKKKGKKYINKEKKYSHRQRHQNCRKKNQEKPWLKPTSQSVTSYPGNRGGKKGYTNIYQIATDRQRKSRGFGKCANN